MKIKTSAAYLLRNISVCSDVMLDPRKYTLYTLLNLLMYLEREMFLYGYAIATRHAGTRGNASTFGSTRETLCLAFTVATNSRRDTHVLLRRTGTRGLALVVALGGSRCRDVAARGQQTPPLHLLQLAISPGKHRGSGTQQYPSAAYA